MTLLVLVLIRLVCLYHFYSESVYSFPLNRALLVNEEKVAHEEQQSIMEGANTTFVRIQISLGTKNESHYIQFYAGHPPQKFSLVVDTGSTYTALPCSECETCKKRTESFYALDKSDSGSFIDCGKYSACSSCEHDQCRVNERYSEGSFWKGVIVQDAVWLGSNSETSISIKGLMLQFGFQFPFACQTQINGVFSNQLGDGILGLGRGKEGLLHYMLQAQRIEHNMFSICFHRSGGSLSLGGYDPTTHTSTIKYTKMVPDEKLLYAVTLKDIRINGESLGVELSHADSRRAMIISSASTTSLLPLSALESFENLYYKISGMYFPKESSLDIKEANLAQLPVITLLIASDEEDIELNVPASSYLARKEEGFISQIQFSENEAVLGGALLLDYDILFDLKNNQIGFASASCDSNADGKTSDPIHQTSYSQSLQSTSSVKINGSNALVHFISVGTFFIVIGLVIWKKTSKKSWSAVRSDDTNDDSEHQLQSLRRSSTKTAVSPNGTLRDISISTSSSQEDSETIMTLDSLMQSHVGSPKFVIGDIDEEEEEMAAMPSTKRHNYRAIDCKEFLRAAAKGDEIIVHKYLSHRGDVNIAYGEGWTALHYAVWHGHLHILKRLVRDEHINLNLCTLAGTSALRMALQRQSATMVTILLEAGASRALIGSASLELAQHSSWLSSRLRHMLTKDWSVVWTPKLHARFPQSERIKCQLVVWANIASQRRSAYALEPMHSGRRILCRIKEYYKVFWQTVATMVISSWIPAASMKQITMGDGAHEVALDKSKNSLVYWKYLPWPLLHYILEYAVFLW